MEEVELLHNKPVSEPIYLGDLAGTCYLLAHGSVVRHDGRSRCRAALMTRFMATLLHAAVLAERGARLCGLVSLGEALAGGFEAAA